MKLLEQKIESLLFFKNEPLSFIWLSKKLDVPVEVVKQTIINILPYYENRGISLISTDESVALMTSESGKEIIQSLVNTKEEKELSKQAMETLSIVLYKGSSTKSEIDHIRGVNSVFILRNLLIRGLITKKANSNDRRSPFYIPTHDLLSFLGIENISQLPEFESLQQKITDIEDSYQSDEEKDSANIISINNSSTTEDELDND